MRFGRSVRDAAHVAWFHLQRARRTRSAIVQILVFALVLGGAAFLFTRVLLELENSLADTLHVARVKRPGAMLDRLRDGDDLRRVLTGLLPDAGLLDWALGLPFLAVVHFGAGVVGLPMLAAAAGAEVIAPDLRGRALRWELVRTGRLELLLGRFAGQALLLLVAIVLASGATWIVAMTAMVQQPPWATWSALLAFSPRLWFWALPFLGIGVAASQLVESTNGARGLALAGALAVLGLSGFRSTWLEPRAPVLSDVLEPLLPPSWVAGLWGPGWDWLGSAGALTGLAVAAAMVAWPGFARRNL